VSWWLWLVSCRGVVYGCLGRCWVGLLSPGEGAVNRARVDGCLDLR